jgi:hypothetical protein
MNKFKDYVLAAAGIAALVAVVSAIIAGPAIAQAVRAALIKNVDERGRTPFTTTISCPTSLSCAAAGFDVVPNGKRFVVTHANGTAPPNTLITFFGNDHGRSVGSGVFLPTTHQTAIDIINSDLLWYVEPGLGFTMEVSGGSSTPTSVTLTGYLVDLTL